MPLVSDSVCDISRDLRISRCCWGEERVQASSYHDLQHVLGWFTAECEEIRIRVGTPKSEAMVFCQKTVDCFLWVGTELLPQAKEFKYLKVLFTSAGKMEGGMDRLIGVAAEVMQHCTGLLWLRES